MYLRSKILIGPLYVRVNPLLSFLFSSFQVEAISPAPEEARLLDAVEVKLQREREEMQRRLHDIEARINKEESHLRYLIDRESSLTADLKNETVNQPPSGTLHRNKASLSDLEDERAYENPIQVHAYPYTI